MNGVGAPLSDLKGARALVIGGAGSVGSFVVDALLQEGAEVTIYDNFARGKRDNLAHIVGHPVLKIIDGDIRDQSRLTTACKGTDYVFHLAAAWMAQCAENPRLALDVNVVGTWNVLEAAAAVGVKKVIFSSAGAVYGEPDYVPVDENHPLKTRVTYGASKIAGEKFLEAFRTERGLPYVALRYFNIYGPRHDDLTNTTMVIPRWLDCLERGEPPIIFGDGTQTMDFINIEDVAWANVLAGRSDVQGDVFNIASGIETSANQLAALLIELMGCKLAPLHRGEDPAHVRRRFACIDRARQQLGFGPRIALREGLQTTIQWRRSQRWVKNGS
jgi:UDP-glucose 4-epimerase